MKSSREALAEGISTEREDIILELQLNEIFQLEKLMML
jgi:hypothetical protein